jgi:hypothetical protein
MITPTRERRDWTLLVFIIPIGIILMLIAGQVAIRLVPEWSVNAGMQSNLDPNNLPMQQSGPVQPILPAILTPLGWFDTFLTPGAGGSGDQDIAFPPFVVFEPSATPVVTNPPPTVVTTQPPPTVPTVTDSPTVVVPPVTGTKPPVDETSTPPTSTPPTSTPPTATPPTATATSIVSTPTGAPVIPAPANIVGPPNLSIYSLEDGQYIVLDLGSTPIIVNGPSDTGYDMVYYEMYNLDCGGVCMDEIVVGISQVSNGSSYYEVFNWGDDVPDMNTNVGDVADVAGAELDNQEIPTSELYGPILYQTGIAINVDGATSNPPLGSYQYVVILSPEGGSGQSAEINAIEVLPDPPAAPASAMSVQPVDKEPVESANEAPSPPEDNASPPAENVPEPPADDAPAPPADNAPAPPAEESPAAP